MMGANFGGNFLTRKQGKRPYKHKAMCFPNTADRLYEGFIMITLPQLLDIYPCNSEKKKETYDLCMMGPSHMVTRFKAYYYELVQWDADGSIPNRGGIFE